MNDPRIPNITADNGVQSNTAEPMEAHHSVSRTLELLAAVYPEHMLLVDTVWSPA